MTTRHVWKRMGVFGVLACSLVIGGAQRPMATQSRKSVSYTIADLGKLPDNSLISPQALNNHGQVVGYCYDVGIDAVGNQRAFIWQDGTMYPLPALGGTSSQAMGIDDEGNIVGQAHLFRRVDFDDSKDVNKWVPVIWVGRSGGLTTDAPPFALSEETGIVLAINNKREVVGQTDHAFLWKDKKFVTLLKKKGSKAVAINDREEVLVYYGDETYVWKKGKCTLLQTPMDKRAYGAAINRSGWIAGAALATNGKAHAFLWKDGAPQDLGVLGVRSGANGLNNRGAVVGEWWDEKRNRRAWIWQDGKMIDLNTLLPPQSGWILTSAKAINDEGQILGTGEYKGETAAFFLSPNRPAR